MSAISEETLSRAASEFKEKGYAVIEGLLAEPAVEQIRAECARLAREGAKSEQVKHLWEQDFAQNQYVLESAERANYFFEKAAVDGATGELTREPERSVSKIGFALHRFHPFAMAAISCEEVRRVLRALGQECPTVITSLVDFKNPLSEDAVAAHQDAGFLVTSDPHQLVGMSLALDDVTEDSGCWQVLAGSHRGPPPAKVSCSNGKMELPAPSAAQEEGAPFEKLLYKRGSLWLFSGLLVHKRDQNRSPRANWSLDFILFDKAKCAFEDGLYKADSGNFVPIYAPAN